MMVYSLLYKRPLVSAVKARHFIQLSIHHNLLWILTLWYFTYIMYFCWQNGQIDSTGVLLRLKSGDHSVYATDILWFVINRNVSLPSPWTSSHFATYFCSGDTLSGWMGVCAHMSNNNSYKGALVSVTGVNYVLSCTREPDRAQVLLQSNLFIADLCYSMASHAHVWLLFFFLVQGNKNHNLINECMYVCLGICF